MGKFVSTLFAVFIYSGSAYAGLFTQFVIFGDSLSDNGNSYIATGGTIPAVPYYTLYRFTDGPDTSPAGSPGGLWHEDLSAMLGEPVATPFLLGGSNYAIGGSMVLPGDPLIPSMAQQIAFALSATAGHMDPNALYVLWGGANDLYNAVEKPGETASDVANTESAAVNALISYAQILEAAGARNFLFLNLPQLASTPRGAIDPLRAALEQASTQFRTDLAAQTALFAQTPGVRVANADIYGLYLNILANPAAYGYTNITTPAQGLSVDPDQYLFWDLLSHPTTPGHRLIAGAAETAILDTFTPEPAAWSVAAGGLLLLVWTRRRSRRPNLL